MQPTNSKTVVIGYVRVSTSEQADSGLGLEDQSRRIEAYCQAKGLDLARTIADEGVSGGTPLASRPGGGELARMAKTRKVGAVVVLKLDRAFRNASDCLTTVQRWDRAGVDLHILDLGGNSIDTKSAAGRFMLTVMAGVGEMERNLTRERTRAAMKIKRLRGERYSGHTPFGFDLDSDGKTLTPNQAEQDVLSEMKDLRSRGWTYKRIATELTQRGVRTKQGNERWTTGSVSKMVDRAA